MQVIVGRAHADLVVHSELANPGTVEEPAQDQHRLIERAQRTTPPASASLDPTRRQQRGQELDSLPPHLKHSGVCDTKQHVKPLTLEVNLSQDHFYQGLHCLTHKGGPFPKTYAQPNHH